MCAPRIVLRNRLSDGVTHFVGGRFLVCLAQGAAEGDSAFGDVVGRNRHGDDVAGKDADEVFAHFARNVCDNLRTTVKLDAELSVGKGLHDLALSKIWFFFGHRNHFSMGIIVVWNTNTTLTDP